MRAKTASFMTSATSPAQFPDHPYPEIAFAGRSNVGKSTLINTLVGVSGLARASNTPGRTRLLNWFCIEPAKGPTLAFVDLPGYGYAKVSRSMREAWRPMIEAYLARSSALRAIVLLIDARRGAETDEEELLEWLGAEGITPIVVITKADKLPKAKRKPAAVAVGRGLGLARAPLLVSAQTGEGLAELWTMILRRAGEPTSKD
jgi:GTP-binding protein